MGGSWIAKCAHHFMKNTVFVWLQGPHFHTFSACLNRSPYERTFSRFFVELGTHVVPLWDHMNALFPLLLSSRFLTGVFITFRLPEGTPNGPPAGKGGPSGVFGNIALLACWRMLLCGF